MGTNYYLVNEKLLKEIECFNKKYSPLKEMVLPRIHICKISAGWKPLFQKNMFFSSFEEILKCIKRNPNMIIVDEYSNSYSMKDFLHIVEAFKENNTKSHVNTSKTPIYYVDSEGYDFAEGEWS